MSAYVLNFMDAHESADSLQDEYLKKAYNLWITNSSKVFRLCPYMLEFCEANPPGLFVFFSFSFLNYSPCTFIV